ncbi:MAG TPA: hypothetical protein VF914_16525 [Chloroflexia bacterium]|jgi:hypothetical protein
MARHFIRLAMSGVATFLAATCFLYTLLMYTPTGPPYVGSQPPSIEAEPYSLDKPWPVSFLAYMFNPSEITEIVGRETYPKGLHISLLGWDINGSGLLTADFGRSIFLARGVPVLEVYGPGLYFMFACLFSLMVTFGYVATVQRLRVHGSLPPALDFAEVGERKAPMTGECVIGKFGGG